MTTVLHVIDVNSGKNPWTPAEGKSTSTTPMPTTTEKIQINTDPPLSLMPPFTPERDIPPITLTTPGPVTRPPSTQLVDDTLPQQQLFGVVNEEFGITIPRPTIITTKTRNTRTRAPTTTKITTTATTPKPSARTTTAPPTTQADLLNLPNLVCGNSNNGGGLSNSNNAGGLFGSSSNSGLGGLPSNEAIEFPGEAELLENKQLLLECLQELSHVGVVLLKDAPRQSGQLKRLAEKIGFFRTTHYGNELTVRSIPDAVNLAYTSAPLNVHTDLPYYAYPSGVQALHCIRQFYGESDKNAGGKSILVDGFIVADHMSREKREDYETLCNIPVEFYDIGQDFTKFYKIHHSPTFVTCPFTSRLIRIVYSNQQLSSYLPIDLEKATGLYRAFKTFTDLCYHEKYLMIFKMSEGDVIIFDNWRFLHGRTGFDPKAGERHLEGCYFDWDDVFSTIRVSASELQQ